MTIQTNDTPDEESSLPPVENLDPADILPQDNFDEDEEIAGDWSTEDLEGAYLRALEASEGLELEIATTEQTPEFEDSTTPVDFLTKDNPPAAATIAADVRAEETLSLDDLEKRQSPRQIIEAILFVGGEGLTSRKISHILRDALTPEAIEEVIRDLNELYVHEQRPYEISLQEGGYRMGLRPEFEKYRMRLFGYTPKEVRLPQDALELLAFIAYKQPVTKTDVEELNRSNTPAKIRLLLRHQLITLQREGKIQSYITTSRFLHLFGLSNLKELPRSDDLSRK
jgi:segregation and condensation protein B